MEVSDDGFLSLLMENGEMKEDLKVPDDDELAKQIMDGYEAGKDLVSFLLSHTYWR